MDRKADQERVSALTNKERRRLEARQRKEMKLSEARDRAESLEGRIRRPGMWKILAFVAFVLGFAFPIGVLIVDSSFFNGNFILMGGVFIACMGLGVAAQHMDFSKEDWYRVIENTVPPKTIDINRKAFDTGYHLTAR